MDDDVRKLVRAIQRGGARETGAIVHAVLEALGVMTARVDEEIRQDLGLDCASGAGVPVYAHVPTRTHRLTVTWLDMPKIEPTPTAGGGDLALRAEP